MELKCECGQNFNRKGSYETHRTYCDESDKTVDDEYTCACGRDFKNKGAYESHRRGCDSSSKDPVSFTVDKIECPDCGSQVAKTQLPKHRNSDSCGSENLFEIDESWKVDGDYECPECGEVYSEDGIKGHYYAKHTKEGRKLDKSESGSLEKVRKMNRERKKIGHFNQFEKARKLGNEVPDGHSYGGFSGEHTEETKQKISRIVSRFYKNNPEKHPWKNDDKFVSEPCEELKAKLDSENIDYEDEITLLDDRLFSADIVLRDRGLVVEVNGKQHYEKPTKAPKRQTGTKQLKNYYSERHRLFEEKGWIVLELYYKEAYAGDIVSYIISR